MILDSDESINLRSKIIVLCQSITNIFTECYTHDQDLHVYGSIGNYDLDKVQHFYTSKESGFRKKIKQLGVKPIIWKDFHNNQTDTITYNFYWNEKRLFKLILYFEFKNEQLRTYSNLAYQVLVDDLKDFEEDIRINTFMNRTGSGMK